MRQTKPGSALLVAALAATLLAGAAATMMLQARSARAGMGDSLRLEHARLDAQALIAMAVTRLDAGGAIAAQGEMFADAEGGRVLRQDTNGLVDINQAPPELLIALLTGVGETPEQAIILADRILDWRDEDNLVRAQGAERALYLEEGLPAPGNRAFVVETEIAAVMGVGPALASCLAPFLTTYSGSSDIDANAAPPALRQMLGRDSGANFEAPPPFGRVVRLDAESPLSEQAALRVTMFVRLTGDPRNPFVVHRASEDFIPRDAPAPGPCIEREQA